MKHLLKALSLGVVIVLSTSFAKADPNNQISFAGFETFCSPTGTTCTPGSVTFGTAATNVLTGGATGMFSDFNGASTHFNNFNYLSTATPFSLFSSTSTINSTESLVFQVTSLSYTYANSQGGSGIPGLDIFGVGNYLLTASTGTSVIRNGAFDLTTQGAGNSVVSFSDTNTITPEPSSLVLLGTGLVSAAGMLVRRRRGMLAA